MRENSKIVTLIEKDDDTMKNEIANFFSIKRQIEKNKILRVLGIDLGTTNSTVADIIYNPKENTIVTARCIEIDQDTLDGRYTHVLVPSVVALYNGKVFVGEGAKRLRSNGPEIGLVQNKNLFYECKNDIGLMRTYHMAPEGYKSASEIGGVILKFLYQSALLDDKTAIDRVVVTVPASFQGAQRSDTIKAAKLAGIELSNGDLLDEPIAAFLDYLFTNIGFFSEEINTSKNIVIFDFGGGTCDIAIFKIMITEDEQPLKISPLSVSRYHRLGGGDIDKAIVYNVLIPQLLEQNNLTQFALTYEDKKNFIEPELLSLAEALKIGICMEISRLNSFGRYKSAEKDTIKKIQPGIYKCKLKDKILTLTSPQITAQQFENLLIPFIDTDFLYARVTEYYMTCSIFSPLQDALDRSRLTPENIHYCLMVGGSSQILQVAEAIRNYLCNAKILTYKDKESLHVAIARGAAYHAFSQVVFGKGLIQPVCHEQISIKTLSGMVELVPKGAELPYPNDNSLKIIDNLAVPETVLHKPLKLRLELIMGGEQSLYCAIWEIPGPLNKGDVLCLEYRYDENQIFDFRIKLKGRKDSFYAQIENPLTNVVNPNTKLIEIAELEEAIRRGKIPKNEISYKLEELAEKYSDLGQKEKAIDFLKRALRAKNKPDAYILNKIGILCGEIGDYEKEEKFYKEASLSSSWTGPIFNLALSQQKRGKYKEAIENIEQAIKQEPEAPYFVFRAVLAQDIGNQKEKAEFLQQAMNLFKPLSEQSDWELGWYLKAVSMLKDEEKIKMAKREQMERAKTKNISINDEGILPMQTQWLSPI